MYKGKVVEQGFVKDIFNNPQHPYTKGLLACRPPLAVRYSKLPTVPDFMETLENGEIVSKQDDVKEYVKSLVLPNLICTPHTGGNSHEAVVAMGLSSIEHLIRYRNNTK